MCCTLTVIVGIDTHFEFVGTQQSVCFRHSPLAMDPFRLDRMEPRTFAGQRADDETYPRRPLLALWMVLVEPTPHGMTAVPGGVIPDQQACGEASGCKLCGAPRQNIAGDGTHGASRDKPEPHLVCLLRPWPHQQAITGQRLGSRGVRRRRQFLPLVRGLCVRPVMLGGLGEPTPPDFVANAQRPRGLRHGPRDQAVAPVLFRIDAGSGLVIQCLARFQATPHRRRATRLASSLTSRGVRPSAKRTSAARASGPRLVGLPHVRGLWCHSARRASQPPASKMVAGVWGRDAGGWSAARPRWWKA